MEAQAKRAEESAAQTELVGKAMEGAADDTLGLANAFRENVDALRDFETTDLLGGDSSIINRINDLGSAIPLVGGLFKDLQVDIVDALSDAGLSFYDFSQAVNGSSDDTMAFGRDLQSLYKEGKITEEQFWGIVQAVREHRTATQKARAETELFNVTAEEANAILTELGKQKDPLGQLPDEWNALVNDMRDGEITTQAAADAINRLALELGLTQAEVVALAQGRLEEELDQISASADKAAGSVDDITASINELQAEMSDRSAYLDVADAFDDVGAAALEALEAAKNGSADAEQKARDYERAQMSLTDEVLAYDEAVGGLPTQVLTDILTAIDEGRYKDAENALGLLELDRAAKVEAEAYTVDAEGDLNYTARDRDVKMTATVGKPIAPSGWRFDGNGNLVPAGRPAELGVGQMATVPVVVDTTPAVTAINDLVRERTINVRVIEQSAARWWRVNGRFA
jgi:hypothetical protein